MWVYMMGFCEMSIMIKCWLVDGVLMDRVLVLLVLMVGGGETMMSGATHCIHLHMLLGDGFPGWRLFATSAGMVVVVIIIVIIVVPVVCPAIIVVIIIIGIYIDNMHHIATASNHVTSVERCSWWWWWDRPCRGR